MEFMYLVFTHVPGVRVTVGSLGHCCCNDVIRALINPLVR